MAAVFVIYLQDISTGLIVNVTARDSNSISWTKFDHLQLVVPENTDIFDTSSSRSRRGSIEGGGRVMLDLLKVHEEVQTASVCYMFSLCRVIVFFL